MTSELRALGFKRMLEVLQRKEDTVSLFNQLHADRGIAGGAAVFQGAISALCGVFIAGRRAGYVPTCEPAALQAFLGGTEHEIILALTQALNGGGDQAAMSSRLGGICAFAEGVAAQRNIKFIPASAPTPSGPLNQLDRQVHKRDPVTGELVETVYVYKDSGAGSAKIGQNHSQAGA